MGLGRPVSHLCLSNRLPSTELAIRPVVPFFQHLRLEPRRFVDDMSRVVDIPVARNNSPLAYHSRIELRSRIWRHDVERRGRDPLFYCPVHRSSKYVRAIIIHAKHKTAVDLDAERVEPVAHCFVVAPQILSLV